MAADEALKLLQRSCALCCWNLILVGLRIFMGLLRLGRGGFNTIYYRCVPSRVARCWQRPRSARQKLISPFA